MTENIFSTQLPNIKKWIRNYGGIYLEPQDNILDEYKKAKSNLISLFPPEGKISKEILYSQNPAREYELLWGQLITCRSTLEKEQENSVAYKIFQKVLTHYPTITDSRKDIINTLMTLNSRFRCVKLASNEKYDYLFLSDDEIATNKLKKGHFWKADSCYVQNYEKRNYKIDANTKVLRILKKNLPKNPSPMESFYFEIVQNFQSIANQKCNHKGTLTLSILPIDFLTLSDTCESWISCLNWRDEGAYRAGTVEMLNSPTVAVAYLSNKENNEYHFAEKIWRQLIIISADDIIAGNAYPYDSPDLTAEALHLAANLFPNKSFSEVKRYEHNTFPYKLETTYMYNDFYGFHNFYAISTNEPSTTDKREIVYSGQMTCMQCGQEIGDNCIPYSHVFCEDCQGILRCSDCGQILDKDNCWYDDYGNTFCEDCYSNRTTYCNFCQESVWSSECYELTYIRNKTESPYFIDYICRDCLDYYTILKPSENESNIVYVRDEDLEKVENIEVLRLIIDSSCFYNITKEEQEHLKETLKKLEEE